MGRGGWCSCLYFERVRRRWWLELRQCCPRNIRHCHVYRRLNDNRCRGCSDTRCVSASFAVANFFSLFWIVAVNVTNTVTDSAISDAHAFSINDSYKDSIRYSDTVCNAVYIAISYMVRSSSENCCRRWA